MSAFALLNGGKEEEEKGGLSCHSVIEGDLIAGNTPSSSSGPVWAPQQGPPPVWRASGLPAPRLPAPFPGRHLPLPFGAPLAPAGRFGSPVPSASPVRRAPLGFSLGGARPLPPAPRVIVPGPPPQNPVNGVVVGIPPGFPPRPPLYKNTQQDVGQSPDLPRAPRNIPVDGNDLRVRLTLVARPPAPHFPRK